MNKKADPFFQLGARIGAAVLSENPEDFQQAVAKEAVLQSREGGPYQKELCKIAAAAFETDNAGHTAPGILFKNLAQVDQWEPAYNRFTDCVRRALAKQAAPLIPAAIATHDKLGGNMLKTLTAGGALGGAALGSLAFLLSRNAQQSSAENQALLEKIRAYKQLRRDIEEDMAARGVMDEEVAEEEKRYDV